MKHFNKIVLTALLTFVMTSSVIAASTDASLLECKMQPLDIKMFDLGEPVVGHVKLDKKRQTLIEFFWYGCPHCTTLNLNLRSWLVKDKTLKFVRIPAIASHSTGTAWETGAQIYYALLVSGVFSEDLHSKIFDAIHKDKKKLLFEKETFQRFLLEQGLSFAVVKKTMDALESVAVKNMVEDAKKATVAYKLSGTPTLVLENRYQISSIEANGVTNIIPNMKKLIAWKKRQLSHCKIKE